MVKNVEKRPTYDRWLCVLVVLKLSTDRSMPVVRPVHRVDQPMPTQTSPVQIRQSEQIGNENIRSVESVSSQQTNTSPNSTLDYPPPSLREGAVNSHEVSCISLGTLEKHGRLHQKIMSIA